MTINDIKIDDIVVIQNFGGHFDLNWQYKIIKDGMDKKLERSKVPERHRNLLGDRISISILDSHKFKIVNNHPNTNIFK